MNKLPRSPLLIMLPIMGLMVAGFATFAWAQSNNLIEACVKNNNGSLRIVTNAEECKNNESYLSWNQQGLPGPSGPPGSGGSERRVVDSIGQELGILEGGYTIRHIGNYWVSITHHVDKLITTADWAVPVWYITADCSGTPYMEANTIRESTISGNTLYFASEPYTRDVHSVREFTSPEIMGECETTQPGNKLLAPVQTYELPNFVPPFSIVQ